MAPHMTRGITAGRHARSSATARTSSAISSRGESSTAVVARISRHERGVIRESSLMQAATDDFWRLARASVDGQREFVLELSGVSFLDSSGIKAVVALARELEGRGLVLRNPADNVRKVLGLVDVRGAPDDPPRTVGDSRTSVIPAAVEASGTSSTSYVMSQFSGCG
jgi:anti-anti-sigma regulatory factor